MSTRLEYVLAQAWNGVVLDTNVMLAFVVGLWNPDIIQKFKRTASYSVTDFNLLISLVERCGRIVTTPHILTEVCNLTDTLNSKYGGQVYQTLFALQGTAKERRQEAIHLMADPLFLKFGIADMSLIDASKKHYLVVTDEAPCFGVIASIGGLVLNLNHLRGEQWLSAN